MLICDICNKTVQTEAGLRRHKTTVHNQNGKPDLNSDPLAATWVTLGDIGRAELAAERCRSVRIKYLASDGEVTNRTIDIYGVGGGYVDAYCRLRKENRTFKISRIQNMRLTDLTFVPPANYQPSEWVMPSLTAVVPSRPTYRMTPRQSQAKQCFVATAVYKDPHHPTVVKLREFRERALRRHWLGRAFINAYDVVGPIGAALVTRAPILRMPLQAVLGPIALLLDRLKAHEQGYDETPSRSP